MICEAITRAALPANPGDFRNLFTFASTLRPAARFIERSFPPPVYLDREYVAGASVI